MSFNPEEREGECGFAAGLISLDEDTHHSLFELLTVWSKAETLIYFGLKGISRGQD